jgi:hypothetical protein
MKLRENKTQRKAMEGSADLTEAGELGWPFRAI